MGSRNIFKLPENKESLEQLLLLVQKNRLVPFLGAGFSAPACPTWGTFLKNYFNGIKKDGFLMPGDENRYRQMENLEEPSFEKMADWLIKTSGRQRFQKEMRAQFDKPLPYSMMKKFGLLHNAFKGLKVTTNFDCFIEDSGIDGNIEVCRGDRPKDLERLLILFEQNSLLKIHGGLRDIQSIVLTSQQYESVYGHPTEFCFDAPLPKILKQLFTGWSVLFIGCSLYKDRTLTVMEKLDYMRPQFAVMQKPNKEKEKVSLVQRLSHYGITPIWIKEFLQIEEILQMLVRPSKIQPTIPFIDHGVTFVGRKKELKQIQNNINTASGKGGVQMITGRLFSIDGAGGMGKTTLAVEAAKQMAGKFKDGVIAPIRVDEHTPASFAMHLAGQFHLKVAEPPDSSYAQALVTTILKERYALLVLDNAVEWKNLKYMLPTQTCSVILVTTRNREIYDRIRIHFSGLQVHEIALEKFTEKEALDLFRKMLGKKYSAKESGIYLEIAVNLGFLPLALRQAISLRLFGPHYTASKLRDKLANEDRLELLRRGNAEQESDCFTVESVFDMSSPLLNSELIEALEYLAVCCPGPIPLYFLQQLSQDEDIEERLEKLHTFSWCERREIEKQRYYELHQLVRELVQRRFGCRFRGNFIQLVHNIFTDESVHFSIKERFMPQLEEAFVLAVKEKDERLIDWLYELYNFCTYRGLTDFYMRLTRHVEELFPDNMKALGWVYGYRALILRRQGKLEEAMSLHKKEEKIKEELGERAELASCYGNQAGILYIWGKFEDAMAHYKKQEEISEELGDRSQLASSYCGQALILRAWDKLKEAMSLHKKEEKIKRELDDRVGLAISWWNQGYIYEKKGDYQKQEELWRKSIEIKKTMGISTENLQNALGKLLEKIK